MKFFFLMGRGIKQAIWTFSIITSYQQSFGIIGQVTQVKNFKLLKIVKNFAPICAGVMCVLRRITRHQIVLNLPLCNFTSNFLDVREHTSPQFMINKVSFTYFFNRLFHYHLLWGKFIDFIKLSIDF